MKEEVDRSRRSMLWIAPLGGVALRMPAVLLGQKKQGAEEGDEEVTPTEDLMREHGLLKRILLIYDEVDARIAQQKEFPPDAVTNSAKIFVHSSSSITRSWKKITSFRASANTTCLCTWSTCFNNSTKRVDGLPSRF